MFIIYDDIVQLYLCVCVCVSLVSVPGGEEEEGAGAADPHGANQELGGR